MKGDFLMDGASVYDTYGVFVLQNGYTGILSMPSFKSIETVEWLEEDGLDADLSAPVLDRRSFTLPLGFNDADLLDDFFAAIGGAHAHTFGFSEIGRTRTLRCTNTGSLRRLVKDGSLALSLTEDVVTIPNASPYATGATRVSQRGYKLGNIDLSRYGCWLLDGSLQSADTPPAVRENLIVSSRRVAGQTYYGQTDGVVYKGRDISLSLLINARSVTEFNRCYDALFYALTQPGERTLKLGSNAAAKPCFYKSSRCNRLEICKSGTIWCQFTLTLTVTS